LYSEWLILNEIQLNSKSFPMAKKGITGITIIWLLWFANITGVSCTYGPEFGPLRSPTIYSGKYRDLAMALNREDTADIN
jgi:hypothetical protein